MSEQNFSYGEKVRHAGRPEWGIGTIVKVEPVAMNGQSSQRLSVRFPNAGVKSLITGHAELQRCAESIDPFADHEAPTVKDWDKLHENDDWLAPMAKRKVQEAMVSLPQEVRDPFTSLQKRLTLTLGLYRFDRSGRGLIDWAVAQTGLDDPLTRFNRHELEQHFDRWAFERENHLAKLMQEIRAPGNGVDQSAVAAAVKSAPAEAQAIVRRITASR